MMSNYLQQRNRIRQRKPKPALTIVFFVIIFIIAIRLIYPSTFSGALHFLSKPMWSSNTFITGRVSLMAALLRSKQSLVTENKILKQQIKNSASEILTLEMLRQENIALKEVMGRNISEDTTLATVLVRPNVSPYDSFIIDIGENYGIEKGNYVIVSDDIVIGVIDSVYGSSSVVKLFSAPGERTNVAIGPNNVLTEAIGRGGGNFIARVPRGVDVAEDDLITMPGINQKMFGIVEEIIANPTDPFQTILFKNPVNMQEVRLVQVEKSK
jgi:cell shape-determining protein MreC